MALAAVFIDGGYLTNVLRGLADGHEVFRVYYYDCLPCQGASPTPEERTRYSSAKKWMDTLNRLERFKVRLGRLQYRGTDDDGSPIF